MSLVTYPRKEDFFPKTRRGHGTTHPQTRFKDGRKMREANPCVDPTCNLNSPKSKNLHTDQFANIKDWCDDHKVETL